jgi:hypothetical protein
MYLKSVYKALEYSQAMKSAELHASISSLANSFLALNIILTKLNVLFYAEIN